MRQREADIQAQLARQREIEERRAAEEAETRANRDRLRKQAEEERIRQLAERHIKDLEVCFQSKLKTIKYYLRF